MFKKNTLKIKHISYAFSSAILFNDISFTLGNGHILNIYGDNGCGKTTLLRILTGLLRPHEGEICWGDTSLVANQAYYNQHMLYIGHQTGLKAGLTALENLALDCLLSQQNAKITPCAALLRLGLDSVKNLPVEQLSAGQAKRVALARLFSLSVPLWIIDEPYTHLDQHAIIIVNELIKQHLQQGGLAIIATHSATVDFKDFNLQRISLS